MKRFLFLLLLTVSIQANAGGLSAWQESTPYGHTIEHDGTAGGWVCMSMDTNSVCFQSFYFYKGHTIASSDSLYFIINEKTELVQRFTDRINWEAAIKQQHLDPVWKRIYSDDYSSAFGDGTVMFLVFFPVPFLMPLLWLFCIFSLLFPWRFAYRFRKHYAWGYPAFVILILLFNQYPQSF